MSMLRSTRKELIEKFTENKNTEIKRLVAEGIIPDDLSDIPEITDWGNALPRPAAQ